jgi:hypothetical protein
MLIQKIDYFQIINQPKLRCLFIWSKQNVEK